MSDTQLNKREEEIQRLITGGVSEIDWIYNNINLK